MLYTIRYKFSQPLHASAEQAFGWCTDFSPKDPQIMEENNAVREKTKISDSTVILKETFHTSNGEVAKEKLVHLYPDRYMWVSTHISGPNRNSQFIYEITSTSKEKSKLDFTAIHIENRGHLSEKAQAELTEQLCSYDSAIWKLLAAALEKDLHS